MPKDKTTIMARLRSIFSRSLSEQYNSEQYSGVDPNAKTTAMGRLLSIFPRSASEQYTGDEPTPKDAATILTNLRHENEHNRHAAEGYVSQMQLGSSITLPPTDSARLRQVHGEEAAIRRKSRVWIRLRKMAPWISLAIVETILISMLTLQKKAAVAVGATACVVALVLAGIMAWRMLMKDNESHKEKLLRLLIADDVFKETIERDNERNREGNMQREQDLEACLIGNRSYSENSVELRNEEELEGYGDSAENMEEAGAASSEKARGEKEDGREADLGHDASLEPAYVAQPEFCPLTDAGANQNDGYEADDGQMLTRASSTPKLAPDLPVRNQRRTDAKKREDEKDRDWAERSQHDKKIKVLNFGLSPNAVQKVAGTPTHDAVLEQKAVRDVTHLAFDGQSADELAVGNTETKDLDLSGYRDKINGRLTTNSNKYDERFFDLM